MKKNTLVTMLVSIFVLSMMFMFVSCDETTHTHTFDSWTVVKAATCTIDGTEEQTCICGEKQTRTINAGHTLEDATCTSPQKCTVCGETTGEALGHTTDYGTCSRCDQAIFTDQGRVAKAARRGLELYLVPRLKNPSSLTINSVLYHKYESNTTPGQYLYWISINYSAMNGFGGYNRNNVVYYCDNLNVYEYEPKNLSDYTMIDANALFSDKIEFLNEAF